MPETPNTERRDTPSAVAKIDHLREVLDQTGNATDTVAQKRIFDAITPIAEWLNQFKNSPVPGNIKSDAAEVVLKAHAKMREMSEIQRAQEELDGAFDEVVEPTNLFKEVDKDTDKGAAEPQQKAA